MAPMPTLCEEKQWLMARYIKAGWEYHRMQAAQIAALRNGQGFQFAGAIKGARRRINEARRAISAHERVHGC
jgi:hypothetical protein